MTEIIHSLPHMFSCRAEELCPIFTFTTTL